jgi:hypothetical protein
MAREGRYAMRPPEDYFERDEDGIRLNGHRMWLEVILEITFASNSLAE